MSSPTASASPLSSLIPPPTTAFGMVYQWSDYAGVDQGTMIWRQSDDARRWDILFPGRTHPTAGEISIESGFQAGSAKGSAAIVCSWSSHMQPLPLVQCSKDGTVPGVVGRMALFFEIGMLQGEPYEVIISGRTSTCRMVDMPRGPDGEYCYGNVDELPLRLNQEGIFLLEATDTVPPGEFDVPLEFEPNPVTGYLEANGHLSFQELGLSSVIN